jgi:hypothetical protein
MKESTILLPLCDYSPSVVRGLQTIRLVGWYGPLRLRRGGGGESAEVSARRRDQELLAIERNITAS